ncbi:hypothetical protein EMMF5_000201 [Cystobasidiomycetes sp. EMM_F5]
MEPQDHVKASHPGLHFPGGRKQGSACGAEQGPNDVPTSPKAWTYSKDARSKPPNSTAIMRFMRLLQDERPDQLAVATDKMFKKVFAEGDHGALFAADKQTLQSLLGQDLFKEEEWDALLEKAKSQQMKDIMKEEGGQIVKDLTAYGVPYMHFTKDDGQTMNFMGSDRFEIIAFCPHEKQEKGNKRVYETSFTRA